MWTTYSSAQTNMLPHKLCVCHDSDTRVLENAASQTQTPTGQQLFLLDPSWGRTRLRDRIQTYCKTKMVRVSLTTANRDTAPLSPHYVSVMQILKVRRKTPKLWVISQSWHGSYYLSWVYPISPLFGSYLVIVYGDRTVLWQWKQHLALTQKKETLASKQLYCTKSPGIELLLHWIIKQVFY